MPGYLRIVESMSAFQYEIKIRDNIKFKNVIVWCSEHLGNEVCINNRKGLWLSDHQNTFWFRRHEDAVFVTLKWQ